MRVGFGLAAVLVMAGLGAWGQGTGAPGQAKTMIVEPPTPLLPTTAQLIADTVGAAPADSAEAEAVLKEDGIARTESRQVVSPVLHGTVGSGWVKAYQFGDATGALAAYDYFRRGGRPVPAMARINATEVITAAGETVFLEGVSVVRAATQLYPESNDGLLRTIRAGLPKVGGRQGSVPLLPTMLPKEGLDASSERYAIGPVAYQAMGGVLPAGMLAWDKSAEVVTANYSGKGGSRGTLTLLLYPTPQIAGDRGRAIEKEINENGGAAKFGTLKLRRVGPLLGLTTGAFSPEQAAALTGGLHLTQDLSYDKPMPLEFHTEVKKTASLLQNIAVLTGVLILAAVLLGVFLGGARAGWRVMHGKPAASEPEFLTISLRDEPKALFAPKSDE